MSALSIAAVAAVARGASGAAPCESGSVASHFDYLDDVYSYSAHTNEGGHPDLDLLEVRSSAGAGTLTVGLRVAGTIIVDDPRTEYRIDLEGPQDLYVHFANDTAYYDDEFFDPVFVSNWTEGGWLAMTIPTVAYGGRSTGWEVTAYVNQGSPGVRDEFHDLITLRPDIDFYGHDISTRATPFATPTVAITKLQVTQIGDTFTVTAEGTTSGNVRVLLVSMGVNNSLFGEPARISWSHYWEEQTLVAGDPNISLERRSASWASWRFTREYTEASITGDLGSFYVTIVEAKLEVRAIAEDGSWGHANQSFQPTTVSSLSGPGSGFGSALVILVVLAPVVAVVALVIIRKRNAVQPAAKVLSPPPPPR